MVIIFVDEQSASHSGKNFVLAVGFKVDALELLDLRKHIYSALTDILGLVVINGNHRTMRTFPIIHGADLLREYPDEVRVEAVSAIFDLVGKSDAQLYRVGYFLDSLPDAAAISKKSMALSLAIFSMWTNLWTSGASPAMIVSEFDKEDLRRQFQSSTDQLGLYHNAGQKSISVPLDKMIGHYFCKKDEIGCQIADLVGYIALKSMVPGSEFHNKLGMLFEKIEHKFLIDQIVWMNDQSRSLIRV